jgi:hypothetical protein
MVRRMCKRCGEEIPAERLEALPDTWLCVKCSQAVGGEVEMIARQVQTNKKGSLKKNYGGIEIVKRPKEIPPNPPA